MGITDLTKKYTNNEVTIVWKPALCIHSKNCWNNVTGMPHVFNPFKKPWINPHAATTEEMINQVKKCPSGALTYYMNNQKEEGKTKGKATE
jgi:uncharacterized Fe-S cluster protein YjdI